jgi:hypothetical protein
MAHLARDKNDFGLVGGLGAKSKTETQGKQTK